MKPDALLNRPLDDPAYFREALRATAVETGFAPGLVEKDFFCSLLLRHLAASGTGLVFKGGTCLAKVHAGFYRLSEDLDFLIPMPVDASRADRRRGAAGWKRVVSAIGDRVPGFRVAATLTGANNSSQYAAVVAYPSSLDATEQTIRIEIGLREPLLTPAVQGETRTLLLDPISGSPMWPTFPFPCLSREEALAEKMRAALCRREAAIRDFFDIDFAVRRMGFQTQDPNFIQLVRKKLAVPGTASVNISSERKADLRLQIDSHLKHVLRGQDFAEFDLERAFAAVAETAAALQSR